MRFHLLFYFPPTAVSINLCLSVRIMSLRLFLRSEDRIWLGSFSNLSIFIAMITVFVVGVNLDQLVLIDCKN